MMFRQAIDDQIRLVCRCADAHRNVNSLGSQIQVRIRQHQIQGYAGMLLQEAGDVRPQAQAPESHGHRNTQRSNRVGTVSDTLPSASSRSDSTRVICSRYAEPASVNVT